MKIAITGAAGFLGRILTPKLAALHEIFPSDLLGATAAMEQVDVLEEKDVQRLCADVEVVIHLACAGWRDGLSEAENETRILDTRIKGTWNVMQAAMDAGVRRVIQVSDLCIFAGYDASVMVSEDFIPLPDTTAYQQSVYLSELIGREFARLKNGLVLTLRLGKLVAAAGLPVAAEFDPAWLDTDALALEIDFAADLQPIVDKWTELYAATDDKHDPENCPVDAAELFTGRGIEVGHIFYFGTKYSEAMRARVTSEDGDEVVPEMGSYGIGVSRLVGAIIEASHDENGIIWPDAVAPFAIGLVNLKVHDEDCRVACDETYAKLQAEGVEVLYDDRDTRAGVKFANMDLIGLPWQLVIGPRNLKNGIVELKRRATGEREELSFDSVLAKMRG